MWPSSYFINLIWPSGQFEFETPVAQRTCKGTEFACMFGENKNVSTFEKVCWRQWHYAQKA